MRKESPMPSEKFLFCRARGDTRPVRASHRLDIHEIKRMTVPATLRHARIVDDASDPQYDVTPMVSVFWYRGPAIRSW